MKDYLVDVPVKINIWIRPELQKKQFEVIKKARPSTLFIISDGGRNENECETILKIRDYIDANIDWKCTVYRLYEDENQGMYKMIEKMHQLIWNHVDRCIFLEDDIIPSVDYFRFASELLDKYKDDLRISNICGMNHVGEYKAASSDYFFSRQGSIWGVAMWKRTYDSYQKMDYTSDTYLYNLLKKRVGKNRAFWNRVVCYSKGDYCEGHIAGDEFYLELNMYLNNQLQIIPKKNMISNQGATENAAHVDKLGDLPPQIRKVFNNPVYNLDFPMKHPNFVMPDESYEVVRNKIMGYNYPLTIWKMRIWTLFHYIKKRKYRELIQRTSKFVLRDRKNEK